MLKNISNGRTFLITTDGGVSLNAGDCIELEKILDLDSVMATGFYALDEKKETSETDEKKETAETDEKKETAETDEKKETAETKLAIPNVKPKNKNRNN